MTFGEKLLYLRKEILGMTQKDLAESLGVRQSAITAIEKRPGATASYEVFRQLVLMHNVNPMYFISDGKEPPILESDREKALLRKIAEYEKLVDKLVEVKKR